jgi:cytochrome c553
MKKFFKWFGIILGSLLGLVILFVLYFYLSINSRLNKTYSVQVAEITISSDSASVERGRHRAMLCQGCHGENFSGVAVIDDKALGVIKSTNLTSGEGGIGKTYTDKDWVRSIVHGVRPNGKPILMMPADNFQNFSLADLQGLIAYMKTIPPVANKDKGYQLTFLAKMLISTGAMANMLPAEIIDHSAAYNPEVAAEETPGFGKYLVSISGCKVCHGLNLNGGKSPDPNSPPVPNITPGGHSGNWSEADFIAAMQTGKTPEGKILNPLFMPWRDYMNMTNTELTAIYKYMKSLPKMKSAS